MSFFTVPLAKAVTAALVNAGICGGQVFSYVSEGTEKPYVLIEDFSARTEHAQGIYVVHEQFSIKVFDGGETLENGLIIRQQISDILTDEAFEVAGAGLVSITNILELAGFANDGEGNEVFARFDALLHKE